MPKTLSSLLKNPPRWFSAGWDPGYILFGCMVRMVRNLQGRPFPGWSTEADRRAVADKLLPIIQKMPGFKSAFLAEMSSLGYEDRRLLMERKLITSCLAARQKGCYVAINNAQNCSVFVNEEEHFVMHAFAVGTDMAEPLQQASKWAAALEKGTELAFSASRGHLASVPSECGEGLQLYYVMHLPALVMANTLPQISKAMEKLHLNIAPFFPELGDDAGHIFVAYSPPIPHGMKDETLCHLKDVVDDLCEQERNMRGKMLGSDSSRDFLLDQISRAYGLLQYALLPDYKEIIHALSLLRLGLDERLLETAEESFRINGHMAELNLVTAPHHLAYFNKMKEPDDSLVPIMRSDLVKGFLAAADIRSPEFD